MIATWIDTTLLLHLIFGIGLAAMIWRAAQRKYRRGFWRSWPPALLMIWAISELMDAVIYGRRFFARMGVDEVAYESWASLVMNLLSLIAIAILIHRIRRGDVEEEQS